jgi:hypothetical protein
VTVIRKMKPELVALVLALILLLILSTAHAGDDDHHDGGTTPIDITNTADATSELVNTIGGNSTSNRSLALAGGNLGDVDIDAAACMGSTQFSVFVLFAKQSLQRDLLCVADGYDRRGAHDLAAQLRCKVKEIAALDYAALGTNCVEANKFHVEREPAPEVVAAAVPPPPAAECCEHDDDDEMLHETAADLAALKAGLERERQARQAYARKAQAQQVAEAEYAQQVLEKLQTIDQEGNQ